MPVEKLSEHARKLLGFSAGEEVMRASTWYKQHERSLRKTIFQRLFRPINHHKNWIHWQKMLQQYFDFLYCHIFYNECKLLISIISAQNKTEQKIFLLKYRLIASIKCEIQTKNTVLTLLHFLRLKNALKFNVKQRYIVGTTCNMTKFVFIEFWTSEICV